MQQRKAAQTCSSARFLLKERTTLDICVTTDCKSIPVAACRARSFTADQIEVFLCNAAEPIVKSGSRVLGFIGDNAANLQCAIGRCAEKYCSFSLSCACHCLQLLLKDIVVPNSNIVKKALSLCDAARAAAAGKDGLPSVPVFIDSRWTPWYKAMRLIVDN